ncbi:hypothetical protein GCM10009430_01800 [Aquimarina litoralis]|uniref:PpiC domain-containing protein n=1 Tax=Aquimarina litoralis TaxID=584605 RepID=A0ABN1IFF9_9FLAO
MLQYIIQTILFQLIFLIAYDLFHKKDTFFTVNRVYLLVTSLLSLTLPFIKVKSIQETIPDDYVVNLPTVFIGNQPIKNTVIETTNSVATASENINWWLSIYTVGIVVTLFLFVRKIFIIYSLNKKSTKGTFNTFPIRILPNSKDAFTFWNTIYIGSQLSKNEKDQILIHEIVHLKQKHTLDLLWFEIIKIIFWFNPLLYIYHSRIITLHEYISDASAIKLLGKRQYYEQLLNANFETKNVQFANNFFNHTLLKKRIIMLQKTKSKSKAKFKYLAILPLLLVMLTFTAFSQKAVALANISSEKITDEIQELTNSFADTDTTDEIEIANEIPVKEIIVPSETEEPKIEDESKTLPVINKVETKTKKTTKTIAKDSLSEEDQKIVNRLLEIKEDITIHNKSFASRAVLYSEDPGSKGNGGFYFVQKDTPFHESFKQVAFSLQEGEISEPFRTPFGWHLLTVEKIKTDGVDVRHILMIREQTIPFATIEKVPATQNCKDLATNEEIKKCVSDEIKKYVNKHFDMNIPQNLGLKGVNRIYVRFKIDTSGNVVEVESRGPAIEVEEEANRVISSLPKMIPGEHKGEKVNVLYSLPIVFQIGENTDNQKSTTKNDNQTKKEAVLTETLSDIEGNSVEKGYYLITNIFKRKPYFERGMGKLKKMGLNPKWFKNPKDTYIYVYLDRYDTFDEAKALLYSDYDGKYEGDLYILKIQ